MTIPLTQGYEATIDDEDIDLISMHKWSVARPGSNRYARAGNSKSSFLMHRLILGPPPFDRAEVDHINGNGLDNRKSNLRWATKSQNQANSGKRRGNFTSKYRGVYWTKQRNKWVAEIKIDYKRKHLGFFTDELLAAHAYNQAALKYFGEFAKPNAIEG